MFQTLFVYSITILLMMFCVFQAQKVSPYNDNKNIGKKKFILYFFWIFAASLVFSVVFGIRYDVGLDHANYVDIYLNGYEYGQSEILYVIWNNAFSLAKMPYPVFFATISFFLINTFLISFKKEPQLFVFLLFFLFMNGQVNSWNNIIRVSISCCIWVYSINYIERRKLVPFLLCFLLAFGFHTSAIVILLGYPLLVSGNNYFKKISTQLIILAIAFAIRFLFSSVLEPVMQMVELYVGVIGKYEYYASSLSTFEQMKSSGTNMAFYAQAIVNIIIIIGSPALHKFYNNRKFNIIYNIYFVGLFFNYAIPVGFIALSRPFVFLWIFGTIVLAYFAYYLYATHKQLKLTLLLVLFMGIFYGSLIKGVSNPTACVKYQTYSDHPEVPLVPKYTPRSLFEN